MRILAAAALAVLLFAGGVAHAEVILEVDVSDLSAVVFTPTAAFADSTCDIRHQVGRSFLG